MKGSERNRLLGAAGLGLAIGGAAFLLWKNRQRIWGGGAEYPGSELEDAVVDALRNDPHAGDSAIDVSAVAPGVIELTGTAADWMAARRAVEVSQSVPGVSTVVNRLDIEALENQLARTRQRFAAGDPALTETHWLGVGVGTGRRRHSPDTDPSQRDDSVEMRTKAIDRAAE
ncbi:MAG: BON domain-containing protein [Longimicrobiales bacterium]